MFPYRIRPALSATLAATLVAACGGGGSSAPAPQDFHVEEGDTQVTVTWKQEPGVQYWLFYAPSSDLTLDSWKKTTGALSKVGDQGKGVSSPLVVTGLKNGTTYDFILNGRKDGGEGGPAANTDPKVPRESGSIWGTAVTPPSVTMRSAAYGTDTDNSKSTFVAVGTGGKIFYSTDLPNWNVSVTGAPKWTDSANTTTAGTELNGVIYGLNKFMTVGAGGKVYYSTNIDAWTESVSGTTKDLNAIATHSTLAVAVGNDGTIIHSSDGKTWTADTSGSEHLYGVTYSNSGLWIAVGANCTVLTSTNGSSWSSVTLGSAVCSGKTLKGVTSMLNADNSTYTLVAVGSGGTIIKSANGTDWVAEVAPAGTGNLNAAASSTRVIAAGDGGTVVQRDSSGNWTTVASAATASGGTDLFGLLHAASIFTAVGFGGKVIYSY